MRIGIACNLKEDILRRADAPEDALEEYDTRETVSAVSRALANLGYAVESLGSGAGLLKRLLRDPPDLVFNLAEGLGGRAREAHLPAILEFLGIPYTGSDPVGLGISLDKALAKRVVQSAGVPTPPFCVVPLPKDAEDSRLSVPHFPVVVKPLHEGSSMGIRRSSIVRTASDLREHLDRIHRDYGQDALVEAFLEGPEITVGILGNPGRIIGMMEIVPKNTRNKNFVYSVEVKRNWRNEVEYRVPPRVSADTLKEIAGNALTAYRVLACRDIARIDFRLDVRGEPFFLEANLLPGLNPETSDLPILARLAGWNYDDILGEVVSCALQRRGLPACVS